MFAGCETFHNSISLIYFQAPTTILFTPEKVFHSFGYQAEDKYADLAEEDIHKDWYYFRRFKMILHQQTVFVTHLLV
jgi:hypothetical protein